MSRTHPLLRENEILWQTSRGQNTAKHSDFRDHKDASGSSGFFVHLTLPPSTSEAPSSPTYSKTDHHNNSKMAKLNVGAKTQAETPLRRNPPRGASAKAAQPESESHDQMSEIEEPVIMPAPKGKGKGKGATKASTIPSAEVEPLVSIPNEPKYLPVKGNAMPPPETPTQVRTRKAGACAAEWSTNTLSVECARDLSGSHRAS